MTHLFRPVDPPSPHLPQLEVRHRAIRAVALRTALASLLQLATSPRARRAASVALLLLGLVVQGVMILAAAYLVDLSVSLMELWADLARKHLELTL